MRCLFYTTLVLLMSSSLRAEFVVGDADLQDGVYELRYYTQRNVLVKNGVSTSLDSTPLNDLFGKASAC